MNSSLRTFPANAWLALGLLAVFAAGPLRGGTEDGSAPLPLTAGSILAVAGFVEPHVIVEFSASGKILGQLDIVDPGDLLGTPSGLTRLGDTVWVGGETSIHQLNPATGELSAGFPVADGPSLTALCSDGEFLLAGEFVVDAFRRFDTTGALIDTIVLDTQLFMVGADCDAENLYVGSHASGDVHVFDMTGSTVGVIETDLPSDMTGVSLGPRGDTLWVATGVGLNEIHEFDFDGNLLTTFPGQLPGIMGLYVLRRLIFADGFESGDTEAWSVTVE